MQNRNDGKNKDTGFLYPIAGAMVGTVVWDHLFYTPNKRIINHAKLYSDQRCYEFNFFPKVQAVKIRMASGLSIIPITAAAFYLIGNSGLLFGKAKRKDELSKDVGATFNNKPEIIDDMKIGCSRK